MIEKAAAEIAQTPAASPSMPSEKLTTFISATSPSSVTRAAELAQVHVADERQRERVDGARRRGRGSAPPRPGRAASRPAEVADVVDRPHDRDQRGAARIASRALVVGHEQQPGDERAGEDREAAEQRRRVARQPAILELVDRADAAREPRDDGVSTAAIAKATSAARTARPPSGARIAGRAAGFLAASTKPDWIDRTLGTPARRWRRTPSMHALTRSRLAVAPPGGGFMALSDVDPAPGTEPQHHPAGRPRRPARHRPARLLRPAGLDVASRPAAVRPARGHAGVEGAGRARARRRRLRRRVSAAGAAGGIRSPLPATPPGSTSAASRRSRAPRRSSSARGRPGVCATATRSPRGARSCAASAAAGASRSSSSGTTTGSRCWSRRCCGPTRSSIRRGCTSSRARPRRSTASGIRCSCGGSTRCCAAASRTC